MDKTPTKEESDAFFAEIEKTHEEYEQLQKDLKKQAFWDNFSRAWVQTEPEELHDNVLQFKKRDK